MCGNTIPRANNCRAGYQGSEGVHVVLDDSSDRRAILNLVVWRRRGVWRGQRMYSEVTTYTQYCTLFRIECPIFISSIVKGGWTTFSLCAHTGYCSLACPYTLVDSETGMNAPGAISSTLLKISCRFRGLLSPQQMRTRGGPIS